MLGIAAARKEFTDNTTSETGFARTIQNSADRLAKYVNQSAMRQIISSSFLHVTLEQWVLLI